MRRDLTLSTFGSLLLGLACTASSAHAAEILAPDGTYAGGTYNDWQVEWWQTVLGTPVVNGDHPYFSPQPFGGSNGVLFLSGGGAPVTIDIKIPFGTALFFPILNVETSVFEDPPFHGDDEASLTASANALIDMASGLFAEIDGVPVDLTTFRFTSPLFQWTLPEDNVFQFFGMDAPAGTTSDSVGAGYYLLLKPLSLGSHVIRFGGAIEDFDFAIDNTYNVTVTPEPSSLVMIAMGSLSLLVWVRQRRRVRADSPALAT